MELNTNVQMNLVSNGRTPFGCSTPMLRYMVEQYVSGDLVDAPFQRDYRWAKDQAASFWQTIINYGPTQAIHTYQIKGQSRVYVLDGKQRLTTCAKGLEDPPSLGIGLPVEQLERYLSQYMVMRWHVEVDDHRDAVRLFQTLNTSTKLTAWEYYGAELLATAKGKEMAEAVFRVFDRAVVGVAEKPWSSVNNKHKAKRDAIATFWRFVSGSVHGDCEVGVETLSTAKKASRFGLTESRLSKIIEGLTSAEIKDEVDRFERYIMACRLEVSTIQGKYKTPKNIVPALDGGLYRWILAFMVWARNSDISLPKRRAIVEHLLARLYEQDNRAFGGRVYVDKNVDGQIVKSDVLMAMQRVNLSYNFVAKQIMKDDGFLDKRKRETYPIVEGANRSHLLPFATHGNGKTCAGSALENMSQGDDEVAA